MSSEQYFLGEQFGSWLVISSKRDELRASRLYFFCRCQDCGREKTIRVDNLKSHNSCVCKRKNNYHEMVCELCGASFRVTPSRKNIARFCSWKCCKSVNPGGRTSEDIIERLYARVEQVGECIEWRGHLSAGYGAISYKQKMYKAHRVSYAIAHGIPFTSLSSDLDVMHTCDNPPCINPKHLALGTAKDNINDAVAKGRMCRGERHHDAVATENVVRAMRDMYAGGNVSMQNVASAFNMKLSTAKSILRRITWKWI